MEGLSVSLLLSNVTIAYPGRPLLSEVSFAVEAGETVALMGPSGSGKTSLLNCAIALALPASGSVAIDGTVLNALPASGRAAFRLRHIGVVFQFGELLSELTSSENVALPLRLAGVPREDAERRARAALDRVGLAGRHGDRPGDMSGGEQQRVGIARAIVNEPRVLIADEPTGMLDADATREVVALLSETAKDLGTALLVATHDKSVASAADRVLSVVGERVADGSAVTAK